MRRFSSAYWFFLAAVLVSTAFWSACGGGGSNNTSNDITHFAFTPASVSLEPGQTASITATPENSSNGAVSATVTYSLTDGTQASTNISISPGGAICAGLWNAPIYTVCTPATQAGTYQIQATANGLSNSADVFIHPHVDAVFMTAPSSTCLSSGSAPVTLTATACTSQQNAGSGCTPCAANANLCDITSQVGSFNFSVVDATVATIAPSKTDATKLALTPAVPGITQIYASVSSGSSTTTSVAVPYTTCLVDSISLHVKDKTDTSFAVAKTSTASLQADVLDTTGANITPNLTFNDLQSVVGSVSGSSNSGTYTGSNPGYGGIVASCTPPNCNKNAAAVFSNVVTSTVQNSSSDTAVTANETNVYVTGEGAVQMYPVDSTKFTLGTVISLTNPPNSIAMSRDGAHIFLGGDQAAAVVTTAGNSVQTLSFPGKVLAVSPNNAYVLFANTSSGTGLVNIMSASSLTIANSGGFAIPGVKAAAFTPDGNTVYFATGSSLYRYRIVGDSGSTPVPLTGGNPLPGQVANIATSANGTVLFSSTTPAIVADETCNALVGGKYVTAFQPLTTSPFTAPTELVALPNGTGMLAADGSHLDQITITNPNPLTAPFAGCPATGFATAPSTISLAALGGGTVNHLYISHSGHYAAVVVGAQVGIVDLTTGTVSAVPLVDKGGLTTAYTGDFTLDDNSFWVGANDSYVHLVDIPSLTDKQQVQVQIQAPSTGGTIQFVDPTLVVVQPK